MQCTAAEGAEVPADVAGVAGAAEDDTALGGGDATLGTDELTGSERELCVACGLVS
ncbi:MAG TPA: hypothetical protein VGK73_20745 [Polyangiaceae bacterium]